MQKKFLVNLVAVFISFSLFAQKDCFTSISEALMYKDSVKTLILKKQHLKEFPMEILQFKNLERLSLSRNFIRQIPDSISMLKSLHYLDLSSNYIDTLPCGLSIMRIDTLILWDNQIRVFDDCFVSLNLKYLDMRAIQMSRKEQKAIKQLFPNAHFRKDHPCNCR